MYAEYHTTVIFLNSYANHSSSINSMHTFRYGIGSLTYAIILPNSPNLYKSDTLS